MESFKLKQWQEDSCKEILNSFKNNKFSILKDDIGSGKTITALASINELIKTNQKVIVLCTSNIIKQWEEDSKYFPDIKVFIFGMCIQYKALNNLPNLIITTSNTFVYAIDSIFKIHNPELFKYLYIDEYESLNLRSMSYVMYTPTLQYKRPEMQKNDIRIFDLISHFKILFITATLMNEKDNNTFKYKQQNYIFTRIISYIHTKTLTSKVDLDKYILKVSNSIHEYKDKISKLKNDIKRIELESNVVKLPLNKDTELNNDFFKNQKNYKFAGCIYCHIESNYLIMFGCCKTMICYKCYTLFKKCLLCNGPMLLIYFYNIQYNRLSLFVDETLIEYRKPEKELINLNYIINKIYIEADYVPSILIFFEHSSKLISENNLLNSLDLIYFMLPCGYNKIKILQGNTYKRARIINDFKNKDINILFVNMNFDSSGIRLEETTDVIFIDNLGSKYEQSIGRIIRMNRKNIPLNEYIFKIPFKNTNGRLMAIDLRVNKL